MRKKTVTTVSEMLEEVRPFKPMSVPTLYKFLHALKIKPVGVRQHPQPYPADAADRILAHLGFK